MDNRAGTVRGSGHAHPREVREAAAKDPGGNATTGDLMEYDDIRPAPALDDEQPRGAPPAGGTSGADPSSPSSILTQLCPCGLTNVAVFSKTGGNGANSGDVLRSQALSSVLCTSGAGTPSGPMEHTVKAGS